MAEGNVKHTDGTPSAKELVFSSHAKLRQQQSAIKAEDIDAVLQRGDRQDNSISSVYRDENIKIVVRGKNQVVTVQHNSRNTRFDLTTRTKEREKRLLDEVNTTKNDRAMCELADLYLDGELGKKDVKKAYSILLRAANKGNGHAMCKISQLYSSGDLGKGKKEEADKWMQRSAEKGNLYALAITGQMLLGQYESETPGTSKANELKNKALRFLNQAARKGNTRAMWTLGNIYEEGLFGEKDLARATEIYVEAAKTGSPASLKSLSSMVQNGTFPVETLEEILDDLFQYLVKASIGMAFEIGVEQLNGNIGQNPVGGLRLIEQAAFKKYDEAILQLAKCYRSGICCDVDLKLAQFWFNQLYHLYDVSSKEGNVASLWKLGKLLRNGDARDIDVERAESCLQEVVYESNNTNYIFTLGIMYADGRLGNKSPSIGEVLINKAIDIWQMEMKQGHMQVCWKVDLCHMLLDYYCDIKTKRNVICFLTTAAELGYLEAVYILAKIYLDVYSDYADLNNGLKLLGKAITRGESSILDETDILESGFNKKNYEVIITWLKDIAENHASVNISNDLKMFAIEQLAVGFETGRLGEVDYNASCKYWKQLLLEFDDFYAGAKLLELYYKENLPTEYFETITDWAKKTSMLLETADLPFSEFMEAAEMFGKIYKEGVFLKRDRKQAVKWMYFSSRRFDIEEEEKKLVTEELAKMPRFGTIEIEVVLLELSEMAEAIKATKPVHFKVISRVLGDMLSDGMIMDQDIDKAIHWYTESSRMNNASASYALGRIYHHQHDRQNMTTSINWYMKAVQLQNKDALSTLKALARENPSLAEKLNSFLSRYEHRSVITEQQLNNVKPMKKVLDSYPKTAKDMHELGERHLSLGCGEMENVLNATHWFRKSMKAGTIESAVELFLIFKSSMLGNNVIPVAKTIKLKILRMCYTKFQALMPINCSNRSLALSLLIKISSILEKVADDPSMNNLKVYIDNIIASNEIENDVIEALMSNIIQLRKFHVL